MLSSPLSSRLFAGGLAPALLFVSLAGAQSTAPTAGAPAAESESDVVVQLSPFMVSSEGDTGYFSKNTLMGTRTNERLINIPQNIQIVNEQFLDDLNLDNGIDAFKYGVSGVNKREATSGDTFIRGFRVGGNSFLRNGVKFRGNMNIPLYDIDRIEVLKGPAALLFGLEGGAGGVVNYVHKTAAREPEYLLEASLGSFSHYRLRASAGGPITDDLNYRVTFAYTDADFRRRFDYFKDTFFSTALEYRPSDTSNLQVYYSYYYLDQLVSTETVSADGTFLDIARDFSAQEEWAEAPRYTQYLTLTYTNALSDSLQARIFLNASEQEFDFHQVFSARVPDAEGNMNRTYQNYTGMEHAMNFQGDLLKTFETGAVAHKFTTGVAAKMQRLRTNVDNMPLVPINVFAPVYGAPRPTFMRGIAQPGGSVTASTQRTYEGAIYFQEQANMFEDRLIAVVGTSWNGVNTYRKNRLTNTTTDQIDRAWVNRYGLVYKPVSWGSVYYNYSEAVSFYNSTFMGGPRHGEILDPSYTENNEIGIKAETSNGMLFGGIVLFDMDRTNVQTSFTLPDGTPGRGQEGRETNKGWEADIGLAFDNPLGRLQTILTYYDGDSKNTAGQVPNGVTNKMWSAFAAQSFTEGGLKGLRVGFGVYHKDDFPMASAAGQTTPFVAPGYTTTTAFIGYTRERYDFSLNVDNLGDKKYVDGGDSAGAMNISLGRTFRFTATYRF